MTGGYLEVENLEVNFATEDGIVQAVGGVSFSIDRGQTLAVVGESGSGKSVTSAAIMGLHNRRSATVTGSIRLDGEELINASGGRLRELRGQRMAMVFQDPLSALHPFYSVGRQLVEAARIHQKISASAARALAIDMLDRVGIPRASERIGEYPHQFSGGMRQRVMIAMALINSPDLLIADEPTTALDVTVQGQILDLLQSLQREMNMAIVLITHDLGVVARTADQVAVMYGGRIVETGTVREVFYRPQMPYTWGLLGSLPRLDSVRSDRMTPIPGQPPSMIELPSGCIFRERCQYQDLVPGTLCETQRPELRYVEHGHAIRCHLSSDDRQRVTEKIAATLPKGKL